MCFVHYITSTCASTTRMDEEYELAVLIRAMLTGCVENTAKLGEVGLHVLGESCPCAPTSCTTPLPEQIAGSYPTAPGKSRLLRPDLCGITITSLRFSSKQIILETVRLAQAGAQDSAASDT